MMGTFPLVFLCNDAVSLSSYIVLKVRTFSVEEAGKNVKLRERVEFEALSSIFLEDFKRTT